MPASSSIKYSCPARQAAKASPARKESPTFLHGVRNVQITLRQSGADFWLATFPGLLISAATGAVTGSIPRSRYCMRLVSNPTPNPLLDSENAKIGEDISSRTPCRLPSQGKPVKGLRLPASAARVPACPISTPRLIPGEQNFTIDRMMSSYERLFADLRSHKK